MRAEVLLQFDLRRHLRAKPLEHLDVRVAEAVDGLALVPHHTQVVVPERRDDPELQLVRVLELIDHDHAEVLAVPLRDLRVRAEKPHRPLLQIVEVQRRALAFEL